MSQGSLGCFLLLGCSAVFASSINQGNLNSESQSLNLSSVFTPLKQGHLVIQGGGYWSHQGRVQHIAIDSLIGDDFTVSNHNDSNGLVGLGYYIDSKDINRFQMSLGLNFFYLPKTTVTGTVVQESLFTNLAYNYHLTHYPLYVAAKAKTALPMNNLALTLDAGIGANFMQAGGFSESSLDGGITLPDYAFKSHTKTTFSATAGIGLQLAQVLGEIPVECGYRFFYLGQGNFSKTTDQIIYTLNTGDAYANAVVCSVRV